MKLFPLFAAVGLTCLANVAESHIPNCCFTRRVRELESKYLFHPGQEELQDVWEFDDEHRRHTMPACLCGVSSSSGTVVPSREDCCCEEDLEATKAPKTPGATKAPKTPGATKAPKSKACKDLGPRSGKSKRRVRRLLDDNREDRARKDRPRSGPVVEIGAETNPIAEDRIEETSWASPASDEAELIAADPGIWAIPGFLDDEMVNKLKALIEKYSDWLACSPINADEKNCFKFTKETAVQNEEDHKVHMEILNKIQALWPQFYLRDYFHVNENPPGEVGPTKLHFDGLTLKHMPCTVLIYLSDSDESSGGKTVFPYAGDDDDDNDAVTVTPRKGMALTWLNTHSNGQMKEKSFHGVQATTPSSQGRLIITQKFFFPAEDFDKSLGGGHESLS